MIGVTKQEQQLKTFMALSALTYLVVGFAFALVPGRIIQALNTVSEFIAPSLPTTPLSEGKFWLSLAFSMMMTIAALSYIAQHNIRRNKRYIVPLLISKFASATSGMFYFIFAAHFFSHLAITLIDGSLFLLTLFYFVRGNKAFFEAQTAYLRKKPVDPKNTGPSTVVALKGDDALPLLDGVLAEARFFEVLEKRLEESGKSRQAFAVVVKPNFMFMHSKKDHSSYTDPGLVEAFVDRITARGFSNISLVEAQSTYGNYYGNREVLKVAEYVGYSTTKNYRIVDLTEEMVPFDYGGRLGEHVVGPTWRDADFRVSFAKNKTHIFCNYALTLKNIYGTLPMQNKLKEYHTKREYDWPTIETMKHFPLVGLARSSQLT